MVDCAKVPQERVRRRLSGKRFAPASRTGSMRTGRADRKSEPSEAGAVETPNPGAVTLRKVPLAPLR
ncbi:hypothetical protein GCM10009712_28270 [Pseudarthrobacter sulfonivorans]